MEAVTGGRPSPFELWRQANGNPQEYRRLMREHGHLVPGRPEPLPCGWPSPAPDLPVPSRPRGGTGALTAASPPATLGEAAAGPAEPTPPSGEAEGAHNEAVPRGPGAHAGLPSPSAPEGRPAPSPPPGAQGPAAPGGAGRTWTIELPAGLPLLSLNGRDHWRARHEKAKALKDAAIVLTRKARVPRLERIHVAVLYDPPDRRKRDHDNLSVTAKHLTDGLVIAGVVPDDTPQYVVPGRCEVTGTVFPRGRLRMIITDPGGEAS